MQSLSKDKRVQQAAPTVVFVLGFAHTLHAQTPQPQHARQVVTQVAPVHGDVQMLQTCLHAQQSQFARLTELAAAAEQQNRTAQQGDARRDARAAVNSLKRQIWALQQNYAQCFTQHMPTFVEEAEPTSIAPATPSATATRPETPGHSMHESDTARSLSASVRIVRATRIDGTGVSDDAIRTAVNSLGQALEGCARIAPQPARSQITVEFEVRSGGTVSAVQTVERVGSSSETAHCVEGAVQSLRVSSAPSRTAFSYTFGFGAAQ